MKKPGVYVTKDKTKQVLSAITKVPQMQVLVGYPSDDEQHQGIPPAGKNARDPDPGEKAPDMTNAAIAYIMENGAPEVNIPARPTLVPGVDAVKAKVISYWKQAAQAALAGKTQTIDKILHAIGLTAQASVRDQITNGQHEPLAMSTLANRLRRGRTGTKPLLDTAQMRNAVSYVIRRKMVTQPNNYTPQGVGRVK